MATFALAAKAILLNPADDVMIAKVGIPAGTIIEDGPERVEVRQDIRAGHKVARHPARTGEPVMIPFGSGWTCVFQSSAPVRASRQETMPVSLLM